MPKKVIVYSCKWCTRYQLKHKENVIKHEAYCFKNPKNKACKTCEHFKVSLRKSNEREFSAGNISTCSLLGLKFYYDFDGMKTVEMLDGTQVFKQEKFLMQKPKPVPFPISNCEFYKRKK